MRGAAPAPRPAAQPFAQPAPKAAMQQPRPQAAPPVFEDDVVPYGDDAAFDASYDDPGSFEPVPHMDAPRKPEPAAMPAAAPVQAQAPASSSMEEPDDLQAMLQAGFGDGVVFEELK